MTTEPHKEPPTMTAALIDAEMSVPDIINRYPQTEAIFKQFGLNVHYRALSYENLSASAAVNQIDLQKLLSELNQVI